MRRRSASLAWICLALAAPPLAPAQQGAGNRSEALKRADAAFHAGYDARQAGNLELARRKFAEVVRLEPGIAEGHQALGAVLGELGKPFEAVREFEAAGRIKPNDLGIETNLALAYVQAGALGKALPHFHTVLDLSRQPGHAAPDASFYDAYARALAAAGDLDAAAEQFTREESLTGPRADVEDALGTIAARQEKWQQAQERFEHALALDGSLISARIHLGVLLRTRRDLSGALRTLAPLAAGTPPNADALLEYGRTLSASGRDEEAIAEFDAAIKADSHAAAAGLEMAMALQRLGRQQEAVPWFERAVAADPRNGLALSNLGLALTLTGKGKEALEYFRRALEESPKDPVILKDLGVCHLQLSAFDEAIEDFKKALALEPGDPQLHYDLGLAYKFKDRPGDAIGELSRAEQMDPNLQDPPYTLGILYMQLGRLDEAVGELKKAVGLRPENGDAWAILGSTLKQDSRLPEAAEALKKAIPLLPGQPGPLVTLAAVLAEEAGNVSAQAATAASSGESAKAQQLGDDAKRLRGEASDYRKQAADLSRSAVSRQRATFALNAGNQLMLRGQVADAIARYQEAVAADPGFADAHVQLAIAYERQGRSDEARAERTRAAGLKQAQ